MLHFFESNPDAQVHIDCIEQDRNAVNHASALCEAYLDRITFHVKNALRFQSDKKYDLIWSAGLFDYFEDKVFVFMLKKLGTMVAEGGEIVIGNFSTTNPSRPYMELFEWHLHHRSPITLKALAARAGFAADQIRVGREQTGVNLFLHIRQDEMIGVGG
jgi:extracellular factor (EF) 3-hydroxypalmitic acid methyl ester biosynthesis protein